MTLKTNLKTKMKAAKIKKAAGTIKNEVKDLVKNIKEINIKVDVANKKHTVEVITK